MYCHTELIDLGDEEEELVDLNETLLTLFSTSVKFVEVITHPQLISCPRGPNHELTEEEVGIEKRKKSVCSFETFGNETCKQELLK